LAVCSGYGLFWSVNKKNRRPRFHGVIITLLFITLLFIICSLIITTPSTDGNLSASRQFWEAQQSAYHSWPEKSRIKSNKNLLFGAASHRPE
jgi:hypothetical protein